MCTCTYVVSGCACTSVCLCVHMCVSVSVYVCGVPNIKFVSLACMLNEPKITKYENGIYI